jgi:hypothetical protein
MNHPTCKARMGCPHCQQPVPLTQAQVRELARRLTIVADCPTCATARRLTIRTDPIAPPRSRPAAPAPAPPVPFVPLPSASAVGPVVAVPPFRPLLGAADMEPVPFAPLHDDQPGPAVAKRSWWSRQSAPMQYAVLAGAIGAMIVGFLVVEGLRQFKSSPPAAVPGGQ